MTAIYYPLDLWSVFVVQVFGGFWPAVIGLALFMLVIMMFGRVSMYSVIGFMLMFFTCMAMGYGYGMVTIPLTLFILVRFIYDLIGVVGRSRV